MGEMDFTGLQAYEEDYYVRYMDDFVFLSDSKQRLHEVREACRGYLADELDLELPYSKTTLEPVTKGLTFLGYRVFPRHRKLRKRNKKKFWQRLKNQKKSLAEDEIDFPELKDSIESWKGHASHADTENLRNKYLGRLSR